MNPVARKKPLHIPELRLTRNKPAEQIRIEREGIAGIHSSGFQIQVPFPERRGLLHVGAAVKVAGGPEASLSSLSKDLSYRVGPVGVPKDKIAIRLFLEDADYGIDRARQIGIVRVEIRHYRSRGALKPAGDGVGGSAVLFAGPIRQMLLVFPDDVDAAVF